jgi:hypothetical protein
VLTVTHWPGYPPPAGIEDDLSAQMAFRLLERPDLVPGEAEAVSNNHFDQDGLVSIYALVASVQRRTFLEDVAFAVSGLLPDSTWATARRAPSPPTASWSCSPTTSARRPRPGTPSPRRADAGPHRALCPSGTARLGRGETIPAVARDGGDVAMPLREAYEYYGTPLGAVDNYTNGFALQSLAHTTPFGAQQDAARLRVPFLLVHSEHARALNPGFVEAGAIESPPLRAGDRSTTSGQTCGFTTWV